MEAKTSLTAVALSLWLAVGSFYALTAAGHSTSIDGMLVFLAARGLVETGRPAIPEVEHTETHRKLGRDGRWYVKYGPGLVVAHLPALLLARAADPLRPSIAGAPASPLRRDEFYAQLTNAGLAAGAATLLFLTGVTLTGDLRSALAVALLTALASPLWAYAHVDSTEALQAVGLSGALYFLVRARQSLRSEGLASAGGVLLAAAIAAKVTNVILAPWFLLYVGLTAPVGARLGRLAAFVLPLALALAALGLFNVWRFGGWLDTGYDLARERFDHPFWTAAVVLLLSPQFGLAFFWPLGLVAVFGLREAVSRFRAETLLVAAVGGTLFCVYALWWAFWGMNWGPRFLVPMIPLASLFLLPVVARRSAVVRSAVIAAALAGAAVQALCVSVAFFPQLSAVYDELGFGKREGLVKDPRLSPLRIAVWSVEVAAARARSEGELRDRVAHPPWQEPYPWREPTRAVDRLEQLAGLDLWAAPEAWRRDYFSIFPFGERAPKPTSGRLLVAALLGITIGAVGCRRAWRASPVRRS